jgi:hypothetical protein
VTREEAIKVLSDIRLLAALPKRIEALDMAIAALREQPRWIPVDERLPKNLANKVLVCCKNGYVGFGHYEVWRGNQIWYNLERNLPFTDWDSEDCESYEVTHWMPLPPPEVEV